MTYLYYKHNADFSVLYALRTSKGNHCIVLFDVYGISAGGRIESDSGLSEWLGLEPGSMRGK